MHEQDSTVHPEDVNKLSLMKAAIYYSSFARVFPLSPNTKIPLLPGDWTSYASSDPLEIMQWWSDHPTANIALVMDTNFTTVDLDRKEGKDGIVSFNDLKSTKSSTFQTTPSGGIHLLYRHPSSRPNPFYNATNQGSHQGIDIRSGNAYIVASPSVVNNQPYRLHGDLTGAPTLPPDLVQLLDTWHSPVVQIGIAQPQIVGAQRMTELFERVSTLAGKPMVFYHHGDATSYNNDHSAALYGLATFLYSNNLDDADVLSLLVANQYAMNVAFKRKRGDFQAQVAWLWKYTCQKARASSPANLAAAAFEDESPAPTQTPTAPTASTAPVDAEFDQTLASIHGIVDIAALDKALRLVAQTSDILQADAMMQRIKRHCTQSSVGFTFTAIKQRLTQIKDAMAQQNLPANPLVFPDVHPDTQRPLPTTRNFIALLGYYSISIRYNEMTHKIDIHVPNSKWHMDNIDNDQRTHLRDLMVVHQMDISRVDEFTSKIASTNSYHPVREALDNNTWDNQPRVQQVIDCLHGRPGDRDFNQQLIRTWLVSAVRVLYPYGDMPPRGVLTFAGSQNIGKTTFFRKIAPRGTLKEGLHLDAANKDSLKQAVSSWLIELGELDATFRRSDIAALKAHISNTRDEIRLPYAPKESSWQRRSVYAGTVNDTSFLRDQTGNTRFWTVYLERIDLDKLTDLLKGQDLLQFWLEVKDMLDKGHNYLLSPGDMVKLDEHNDRFREITLEEELLESRFDWSKPLTNKMTTNDIATYLGLHPHQYRNGRNNLTEAVKRMTGQQTAPRATRHAGVPGRYWLMPPKLPMPGLDFLD